MSTYILPELEPAAASNLRRSVPKHSSQRSTNVWGLAALPFHWNEKPLKRVSTINPEKLPDDTDPDYEMEYVDIGNVTLEAGIGSREKHRFEVAPSRARRRVRDGDTIVSTVRTYLKAVAPIANPPDNLVVSTGFAVVRPGPDLVPGYLCRLIQSDVFVQRIMAHSVGVSYPAINASDMGKFAIPVPPLDEQRAIAAFLDRETAKIDELIAKKQQVLTLANEQSSVRIDRVICRGVSGGRPTRDSGSPYWGAVPNHWGFVELRRLTPDARPIMYGIVLPGPNVDDGVFIVKGGNCQPGRLKPEQLYKTTFEIEAGYVRSRLKADDIVYAIRGGIGDAEIVPASLEGANLTQDAARISPRDDICPRWLLHCVRTRSFFGMLEAGATGATIRGINIRDLKRSLLPLPPLSEQVAIAKAADHILEQHDELIAMLKSGLQKLNTYRSALISAAVTGQIDVRHYREEALEAIKEAAL